MAVTPNLELEQEALDEHYDITRINGNNVKIDDFALEVRTAIQDLYDKIADLQEALNDA